MSINSMTGFGRVEGEVWGLPATAEVRTVNRRHLDVQVRLPRELGSFEHALAQGVGARVARGRVEVAVKLGAAGAEKVGRPRVDREMAHAWLEAYRELAAAIGVDERPTLDQLARSPGVVTIEAGPSDPEAGLAELKGLVDSALDRLVLSREEEGRRLEAVLSEELAAISSLAERLSSRAAELPEAYHRRIEERLEKLSTKVEIDPARLAQEVVMMAERADVAEELERLVMQVAAFKDAMDGGGAVGRKLDFLCQELHREASTLGSKAQDQEVAPLIVELKTSIERLREQVQNVE